MNDYPNTPTYGFIDSFDLQPDEFFLSGVARYRRNMLYDRVATMNKICFGKPYIKQRLDLPRYIGHFVASLAPGHWLTEEKILDKHTLFPLLSPWLSLERRQELRIQMQTGGLPPTAKKVVAFSQDQFLRYCPACVEKERQSQIQECYWHRLHQVDGVLVCPEHQVHLVHSKISAREMQRNLIILEDIIDDDRINQFNRLDLSNDVDSWLLKIAEKIAWLFEYGMLCLSYCDNRNNYPRYYFLGLKINHLFFSETVKHIFPDELLYSLERYCRLNREGFWIKFLYSSSGVNSFLQRILVLVGLNISFESFFFVSTFSGEDQVENLHEGTYACLNNMCPDHRVKKLQPTRIYYENGMKTVMIRCDCGFAYTQPHWQEEPSSMMSQAEIVSPTAQWFDKFLYASRYSDRLTLNQIAKTMDLSITTVAKYTIKSRCLTLPMYDIDEFQYVNWIFTTLQKYSALPETIEIYARVHVDFVLRSMRPIDEDAFARACKEIEFLSAVHVILRFESEEPNLHSEYMIQEKLIDVYIPLFSTWSYARKIRYFVNRHFGECCIVHDRDNKHRCDPCYRIVCYDQDQLNEIISSMIHNRQPRENVHELLGVDELAETEDLYERLRSAQKVAIGIKRLDVSS